MIKGRTDEEQKLIDMFIRYNQEHLFYFYDSLSDIEKDNLFDQLELVDLERVSELYKHQQEHQVLPMDIAPAPWISLSSSDEDTTAVQAGLNAMQNREVALLTVAGGQGSRLGYDHPKGCFPISTVTKKTLFQIFAEKVAFYSDHYAYPIPWYIMTSRSNNEETVDFFKEHNFFGLDQSQIHFFSQAMNSAITMEGNLILKEKSSIFMNPDGHGGTVKALYTQGLLEEMHSNGIKYLSYFQVDNPLVNIMDPSFIGQHISRGSQVSSKVIPKLYPEEKLGVIGIINEKYGVIEYSDLPEKEMFSTGNDGKLLYLMGSIAIHIFSVDFLLHASTRLPIHFAHKKTTAWSFDGDSPDRKDIECTKFEMFIFDTIPLADHAIFYETSRISEFAPLKNKNGVDSIETCINLQNGEYANWLFKAGLVDQQFLQKSATGAVSVEISAVFAPDLSIFLEKVAQNSDILTNAIFETDGSPKDQIYIG